MLKIKGLKKKKKGKKSKNKEEELFDSAELEQYRREQQQKQEAGAAETSEAGETGKSEEWEKFKALTSGVDDILKKTQGDLDRIKSTSFFQKKAPGSSTSSAPTSNESKAAEVIKAEPQPPKEKWVGFEESVNLEEDEVATEDSQVDNSHLSSQQQEEEEAAAAAAFEEVEEEESELDDDQDLFDTSYVDVVASGEVRLAYVPDSPIKEDDTFDPFDTSIVDKVIKTDPKKKHLVSLGCAVEVLTGKLEKAGGVADTTKPARRRPRTQDLLLDSFDEDELSAQAAESVEVEPVLKSILDDDPVFAEETSAILELPSVNPVFDRKPITAPPVEKKSKNKDLEIKHLVEEFIPDSITEENEKQQVEAEPEDELDDEFAALAAESLAKTIPEVSSKPQKPPRPELPKAAATAELEEEFDEFEAGGEDDPFDTSFASQILPGKFELKLIEKEILENDGIEVQLNPIVKPQFNGNFVLPIKNSSDLDKEQKPLTLQHRDLLGGSTTDLSKIPCPIVPQSAETNQKDLVANDDPFDTSIIDNLVAPGKTELKFLEKELLEETKPAVEVELDNDFNPRAEEKVIKPPVRPDNLQVGAKRVSVPKIVAFDIKSPSNLPDLLAVGLEENSKASKPLTPYYPQNNAPADKGESDSLADPFDTSFVNNYPGKLELKLIEQELASAKVELTRSLSDPDFDPRAGNEQSQNIKTCGSSEQPDIISEEVKIEGKLHTPVTPKKITQVLEESEDFDPFDTSIANVLAPGKAEIKILETELIYAKENPPINSISSVITETLTKKFAETKVVTDVLEQPAEEITVKPLTPVVASSIDQDDIDPFDTSSVGDILPEEVGNAQVNSTPASFNPFLAGNEFQDSTVNDNPFMSNYEPQVTGNAFESGATNPFAFGNESAEPSTDFFSMHAKVEDTTHSAINYENIFSSAPVPTSAPKEMDIFATGEMTKEVQPDSLQQGFMSDDLLIAGDAPPSADIFAAPMDDESGVNDNMGRVDAGPGPPRRPPPPRPGPPKETKDLILSVTGAMEATSSHLLDRLQATRTPSPTPMRDLHSPSPTQFGDLLEVDETEAPPPTAVQQEVNFLGDDFDFQAPLVQPVVTEKRASISDRPVSPITPIKPPMEVPSPIAAPKSVTSPPMRPGPPPAVPSRPKVPPHPPRPPVPIPAAISPTIEQVRPQEALPAETIQPQDTSFADVFGDNAQNVTSSGVTAAQQQPPPGDFTAPFLDNSILKQQEDIFSNENDNTNPILSDSDRFTPFSDSKAELISDSNTFAEAENFNVHPFTDTSATFSDLSSSNALHDTEIVAPFTVQPDANQIGSDFTQDITNISSAVPQSYNIFDALPPQAQTVAPSTAAASQDEFDAFTAKFESAGFGEVTGTTKVVASSDPFDPFATAFSTTAVAEDAGAGFGGDDNFDSFLSLREPPPVPQGTPARVSRGESVESNDDNDFNIFIKPKDMSEKADALDNGPMPALAPPPKSPSQANAFQDTSPRFNPFDSTQEIPAPTTENIFAQAAIPTAEDRQVTRTDSQETPPTPLFDEDVSQPLEDFPRIIYTGPGWEMQLRQPNKKKITGQRFWKKIFVKLVFQGENPVLQLYNGKDEKDPFQELPLQPCYSVSEIGAQQYDQYGKIFTVKLQFIYYKERPGVRPGQVTKAERITTKLSQFAAYAIQGDYQGVKEFGSDLKKLGLPVEHAPQISQLFKIGSQSYEDMKQFSMCIEEALFHLSAHRDRALNYKMEEVQITAVDELYVEQNAHGGVEKQIARVRLFFLGFLSGMPDVELGVNDLVRQGKEVVGRHDIIPVVTEEWIRLENVEFHSCVQQDEYEKTRTIKFKPPDACYIELMRFRIRPPKNRELPLQLKTTICVTGNKVEIHGDILVPGFTSRKLGQIPCEDVMVRIPIPECWIYQFRVEKHFRYGSVKSAHRRTGKVKGIERFLGAIENMEQSLMEVTSGQAKYEHQHRAIVWRMPRLPKEGQGAYTTHNLVVRLQLTSYDQIPEELAKYCYLEFTMPATTVSHTTVRSVSIADSDSDTPPEKYVRQLARHEYRIEIEHSQGEGPGDYIAATVAKPAPQPTPAPVPEEPPAKATVTSDSDSDSG